MKQRLTTMLCFVLTVMSHSAQTLPYQNPNLSAAQRADDLLTRLTLEEKACLMMDRSPAIPRLGIPQFEWWNETLHGVGRNGIATVFPITMGMAATWDDTLVYRIFTAASDEAIDDFFKPNRHDFVKTATEASAHAVIAGTDVECGSIYKSLPEAVKEGKITEEQINTSLRRLLQTRFELGDFDPDTLVEWTKLLEQRTHAGLPRLHRSYHGTDTSG